MENNVKGDAYWITPNGKFHQVCPWLHYSLVTDKVKFTHIEYIYNHPEIFGYSQKQIKKIYDEHNEAFPSEAKARAKILKDIIGKGFIRMRYYHRKGNEFWSLNINKLDNREQDLKNLALNLIDLGHYQDDVVIVDTLLGKYKTTIKGMVIGIIYK